MKVLTSIYLVIQCFFEPFPLTYTLKESHHSAAMDLVSSFLGGDGGALFATIELNPEFTFVLLTFLLFAFEQMFAAVSPSRCWFNFRALLSMVFWLLCLDLMPLCLSFFMRFETILIAWESRLVPASVLMVCYRGSSFLTLLWMLPVESQKVLWFIERFLLLLTLTNEL